MDCEYPCSKYIIFRRKYQEELEKSGRPYISGSLKKYLDEQCCFKCKVVLKNLDKKIYSI